MYSFRRPINFHTFTNGQIHHVCLLSLVMGTRINFYTCTHFSCRYMYYQILFPSYHPSHVAAFPRTFFLSIPDFSTSFFSFFFFFQSERQRTSRARPRLQDFQKKMWNLIKFLDKMVLICDFYRILKIFSTMHWYSGWIYFTNYWLNFVSICLH